MERAVAQYERNGDPLGAPYASVRLAMTLRALGEPARPLLVDAGRVAEGAGDNIMLVQALRCLSWQDRDALNYHVAVDRLERALERAEDVTGPARLRGYILQDLGVMQTGAETQKARRPASTRL